MGEFWLCKTIKVPLVFCEPSWDFLLQRVTKCALSRAGLQQQYRPEHHGTVAEHCPGSMHPASALNFNLSLFESPWQALKASHSHRWSSRCWQTPVWSFRQSTTFPSLSIRKVRPLVYAFTWYSCSENLTSACLCAFLLELLLLFLFATGFNLVMSYKLRVPVKQKLRPYVPNLCSSVEADGRIQRGQQEQE